MTATHSNDDEAFRRFLRRVWQDDITPLLRGRRAQQRAKSASVAGRIAATGGLVADTLLRLKGRPFTRFMTVFGTTVGAILPDAWDWQWVREKAGPRERRVIAEQLRRRAGELALREALALFHLTPTASAEQLRHAWRETSLRWHPDKAPDALRRAEYHVRFVAYQAAYERLQAAYESGRLPQAERDPSRKSTEG
ncbi:MAG: J domain-containing protein [Phycisphaerae bacterium]|jgi:hypothetical protein